MKAPLIFIIYQSFLIAYTASLIKTTNGPIVLTQRPIRVLHGLNDSCASFEETPFKKCIETGAGLSSSTTSLYTQANTACRALEKEIYRSRGRVRSKFQFGFHLIGYSQGGLVARLVFHTCHGIRPLIKRIITIGTPNLGIDVLPGKVAESKLLTYTLKAFEYFTSLQYRQKNWSIYQYLNLPFTKSDGSIGYQRTELIDFLLEDVEVEPIYGQLEAMVNILFTEDTVIDTPHTALLGVVYNANEDSFSDFMQTEFKDQGGLGILYEKGRLVNCAIAGEHLNFSDQEKLDIEDFVTDGLTSFVPKGNEYEMEDLYNNGFDFYIQPGFSPLIQCHFHHPPEGEKQMRLIL